MDEKMGPPRTREGVEVEPSISPSSVRVRSREGQIVLAGRDHALDAVELRARHVERGAAAALRQTLERLWIAAREYEARLPEDRGPRKHAWLSAGLSSLRRAIDSLASPNLERAAIEARAAAVNLGLVSDPEEFPDFEFDKDQALALSAVDKVSAQARRAVVQLEVALSMRDLTREEAAWLHETSALDIAAMVEGHGRDVSMVRFGAKWTVKIEGAEEGEFEREHFGSALAELVRRLRRLP